MSILATTLQVILLIAVVLTLFNIIIFVHELGHFWAAKWRGLQIDRFQIWFGKPLWKKEINGVQYGLGWIPAGGFVALPQMAPMEAIEGGEKPEKPLPPITPLDKIIVAFAGPLFSMLLALASALVVWQVGKPKDFVPTQIVGEVKPGSPAEKAGIRAGDKVLSINGEPVNGFAGTLDSIFESVVLSSGPQIEFLIERPGVAEPLRIVSSFETEPAKWYQRRGLRQVGIGPLLEQLVVGAVIPNSPADRAGIREEDVIVSLNGRKFIESGEAVDFIKSQGTGAIEAVIDRSGKTLTLTLHAQKPLKPAAADPILGVSLFSSPFHDKRIVHPGPLTQVSESLRMMWTTLAGLVTPSSNIGVDHLSGPVGIAKMQYKLLQMEDGWRRILAFMVLFNVNLAVLNMLPFPVLDGGHITLALLEKITGRPVRAKPLEILQTICALMLISLMLFVTSKDIGDDFGRGSGKNSEVVFPAD
jgi:regulator of sigma E protease